MVLLEGTLRIYEALLFKVAVILFYGLVILAIVLNGKWSPAGILVLFVLSFIMLISYIAAKILQRIVFCDGDDGVVTYGGIIHSPVPFKDDKRVKQLYLLGYHILFVKNLEFMDHY